MSKYKIRNCEVQVEIHERAYLLWKKSMILFVILLCFVVVHDRSGLFLTLNHHFSNMPALFWAITTNLGDGFMAVLALLFVAKKRPDMVRAALIGTIVAIPFAQGGKYLTTVVRPGFLHLHDTNLIGHLPNSWSFPSGHTATAAVIFGVIFLMASGKTVRWSMFALIILVGLSRIAVGVHWPIDVVCGWIVGLSSAAAGVMLTRQNRKSTFRTAIIPVFLTIASLVFLFDYGMNPRIPLIQEIYGVVACIFGVHASVSIIKGVYYGRDEKRS